MHKKKLLFIINPISGNGRKGVLYDLIRKHTDKNKYDYKVCHTKYSGHATELTNEAINQGVDIVVAVGGDGTVNEIASALRHKNSALAIIPDGSGNGLARHLGIPLDARKAIDIINQGVIEKLDYGLMNDNPFFCTCGMGFDAFISKKFAEAGKRGLQTYMEQILKGGLTYKPETYVIEDEDNKLVYKAFLIACANASQYGNNAFIAPHASMNDGLMDLIVMEPFSAVEAPKVVMQMFNKTLTSNDHIKVYKVRKITILREKEGVVHCDGDPLECGNKIVVEIIKEGIKVVVNANADYRSLNIMQLIREDIVDWFNSLHHGVRHTQSLIENQNKKIINKLTKRR